MAYDFSGYATKNDLTCSDGRIIRRDAFRDNDGATVPLVWQHGHNDPANVIGHAKLENRKDGVYAYCSFNKTDAAETSRELVENGDVDSLSIYANRLSHTGPSVTHGNIVEVSLVLSGANPGALIDNVAIQHSDGSYEDAEDEAIIYTGTTLSHSDEEPEDEEDTEEEEEEEADVADEEFDVNEFVDSLTDEQVDTLYDFIQSLQDEDDDNDNDEAEHGFGKEDVLVHSNIFEGSDEPVYGEVLSHSQIQEIFEDAARPGMTLKTSFLAHAQDYGIKEPEKLFPDATLVDKEPQRVMRDNSWVAKVLSGCKHTPFSRVKTQWSDLTPDALRAKGYVKASRKKDVVYEVANRTTTPTTIYNKTRMDRDDILDITSFDVVAWMKQNLRLALDEELARAILIGDGRDVSSPDKIKETNIRPIWKDDELFAHKVTLEATADQYAVIDAVRRARKNYKGSGSPVLYTTNEFVCNLLELRDKNNRYVFQTPQNIATSLNVSDLVEVEVMEGAERDEGGKRKLLGIIVNLADYTLGADKGGEVNFFDNFDLDINQQKYLLETRCSGALTKYKSALVIEKKTA